MYMFVTNLLTKHRMASETCLKITKQSGTIHYVPLINQKALVSRNAHMGIHDFKIEKVIIEKEFDESTATHVVVSEKVIAIVSESKNIALREYVKESKDENMALKAKIAQLERQLGGASEVKSDSSESKSESKSETALETVARINAIDSIAEIEEILQTDERNTVVKAAKKRLEILQLK